MQHNWERDPTMLLVLGRKGRQRSLINSGALNVTLESIAMLRQSSAILSNWCGYRTIRLYESKAVARSYTCADF